MAIPMSIVPWPHIQQTEGDEGYLILAHLVRSHPDSYGSFFVDKAGRKVLDNGVIETGEPMPMDELLAIAQYVGANELVLPDAIGQHVRTVRMAEEALEYDIPPRLRVMGVPHGTNLPTWLWCAERLAALGVNALGLSRTLIPWLANDRHTLWLRLSGQVRQLDLHLLGCAVSPWLTRHEVLAFRASGANLLSVDSGVAMMATRAGHELDAYAKPDDWDFDVDASLDPELLGLNLALWRAICSGREGYWLRHSDVSAILRG